MKNFWCKVGKEIVNLDLYLSCIILAFLIGLTFVGVFARYAFNAPIIWQEEVQLACFLWISFLGGCTAFRKGSHVAIELIVDRLPQKLRMAAEILISIIVVALLCFLMKNGFVYLSLLVSASRQTAILKIPYSYIYGIMPWACLLMCFNQIYAVMQKYWRKNTGERETKGGVV